MSDVGGKYSRSIYHSKSIKVITYVVVALEKLQTLDLAYDCQRNCLILDKNPLNGQQILVCDVVFGATLVGHLGVGGLQYESVSAGIHVAKNSVAIHRFQ